MSDGPLSAIDMAAPTFYVADLDAALAWYDEKLGLIPKVVAKDGHPYALFKLGNSMLTLEPIEAALEPVPLGTENTTMNLVTNSDADVARDDLIGKGVSCSEVVASPNFRSFLFRDLDGNRFYFAQLVSTTDEAN